MAANRATVGEGPASRSADIAAWPLGGEGSPALLLHGFGSDHFLWLANQQAIATVAFVSALDLPGHGESSMNVGDGTIAALAEKVAAFLDRTGRHKLHLIGHSLGGGVALALAASRPDLVASLVLIAAPGLGRGVDEQFLASFPRLTAPEAALTLMQRLVVRPKLINKHMVARLLDQLERPGAREALARIADGLARSKEALANASISVAALPGLVIWGEEDAINPPSPKRLAEFGGETMLVKAAGHLPQVEAPRLVNERICEFLARQKSS
jgi:pyruvate dehydrogenase E2 component (dihydrolipoamide acetyltransferase)